MAGAGVQVEHICADFELSKQQRSRTSGIKRLGGDPGRARSELPKALEAGGGRRAPLSSGATPFPISSSVVQHLEADVAISFVSSGEVY